MKKAMVVCVAAGLAMASEFSAAPRDYASDPAFVVKFRAGALDVARRKMAEGDEYMRRNADKMPKGIGSNSMSPT